MAKIVHLSVVPHEPTLPAATKVPRDTLPPPRLRLLEGIERLRDGLTAARPDCIVIAGSDHLCQFFMDNMPPFLVGKAERLVGPPAYEQKDWNLASYDAPIEGRLARRILTQGFEYEVDFAYSDEFVVDHAFTVPLNFMRPGADLPVVPIFLNFMAPPVPPARRYLKLGSIVRRIIEEWDDDMRVAVIATGHMTNGVGGPRMMSHREQPESDWDRTIEDCMTRNDVAGMLSHCSWEEMYAQGNNTPGFLGYVFAYGVADGAPYSWHDYIAAPTQQLLTLLEWSEEQLSVPSRKDSGMSRYAVNKVLWQVARDDAAAAAFIASPETFMAGRPLTAEEHRRLLDRDLAAMFAAGAHPFLLYTFNIKVNGFSFQMMVDYVQELSGVEPPLDIST